MVSYLTIIARDLTHPTLVRHYLARASNGTGPGSPRKATKGSPVDSEDTMKPPILLVSDDIDVFASVDAAERYLEAPDAPNTKAFDRDGCPLRVSVAHGFLSNELVKIEANP